MGRPRWPEANANPPPPVGPQKVGVKAGPPHRGRHWRRRFFWTIFGEKTGFIWDQKKISNQKCNKTWWGNRGVLMFLGTFGALQAFLANFAQTDLEPFWAKTLTENFSFLSHFWPFGTLLNLDHLGHFSIWTIFNIFF